MVLGQLRMDLDGDVHAIAPGVATKGCFAERNIWHQDNRGWTWMMRRVMRMSVDA